MEHIMGVIGTALEAIAQHLESIAASLATIATAVTCAGDSQVSDSPAYDPLPLDQVQEQVEALQPLGWVIGWDDDGVPIADDTYNLVILDDGSVAFPHWCGFSGWEGPVNTLTGADWSEVTDYWTMEEIDMCF